MEQKGILDGLENLQGQEWIEAVSKLDDQTKLTIMENASPEQKIALARTISNVDIAREAIGRLDLDNEMKETLLRMYEKNIHVLKNIDFSMLDSQHLNALGENNVNLVSCYPYLQKKIASLDPKKKQIFLKCAEQYPKDDESLYKISTLLNYMEDERYSTLMDNIENIDSVDVRKLSKILLAPNYFAIKTPEDVDNYAQRKGMACDRLMSSGNFDRIKGAVFFKAFNMSVTQARGYLREIDSKSLDALPDGEEKDYIRALKAVEGTNDVTLLRQIYDQCELSPDIVDPLDIQRKLARLYGKSFKEGLYVPQEEVTPEESDPAAELVKRGYKVYDAGTDFSMIITSVGALAKQHDIENFKKNWNRPVIGGSQHISASYIRNDMLGIAGGNNIVYGFSQIGDTSILQAGPEDLQSAIHYSRPDATIFRGCSTPETTINETLKYNEIDIKRVENGERVQPDYIVAFQRGGQIINFDNIVQASEDWKQQLPIVLVDVDKCLEAERAKVEQMMETYRETGDTELGNQILQKIKNNRATYTGFCIDLNPEISAMRRIIDQKTQQEGELAQNYAGVSATEREQGIVAMQAFIARTKSKEREGKTVQDEEHSR